MKADRIEMVVFDWAGTTTDYGSFAPVTVFEKIFLSKNVQFSKEEINEPMGMEKKNHIRSMLNTENGKMMWKQAQGREWNENDVEELYQTFENSLRDIVASYSIPIPNVVPTVAKLREMNIKVASTTGYTSEMMKYVIPVAKEAGYEADCVVTPDVTGRSRPSPFMIYECMRKFNIYPANKVVKVGDTAMDILEGKNAGAWTVGILEGSNLLGLSLDDMKEISSEELTKVKEKARQIYLNAGVDIIINSIIDLPEAIATFNKRNIGNCGII